MCCGARCCRHAALVSGAIRFKLAAHLLEKRHVHALNIIGLLLQHFCGMTAAQIIGSLPE
jgi:hypothetical protein